MFPEDAKFFHDLSRQKAIPDDQQHELILSWFLHGGTWNLQDGEILYGVAARPRTVVDLNLAFHASLTIQVSETMPS
jgi:hypothetical protein